MTKSQLPKVNNNFLNYIIVLFVITLVLRVILIGIYKSDFGGSDMNVVYGIQRLIMGQPLYQDPTIPSYAIIQYTPVFYHTTARIAKLLNIEARNVHEICMLTRSLALAFNLLTILVASAIIHQWKISYRRSVVFAMPVIMMLTTHYYLRVDSMHFFLFTCALYFVVLFTNKGSITTLLAAALFSGCCIMTKQSGILIVGITGFYLLFVQRKIFAVIIYSLVSLFAAFVVLKLCIHDNWEGFYQNAYLGLKNGIGLDFLYNIFISQFYYDLFLCYFLGGIMAYVAFKGDADKQFQLIATGAVLSFIFAVVTGLKIGSSNNYFTELLLFVIIGFPRLLQIKLSEQKLFSIKGKEITIKRFAFIALFVLVSSKTLGFFTSMYIEKRLVSKKDQYDREKRLYQYFVKDLRLKQGEYVYFNPRNFLDNLFIGYSLMPNKDVVSQVYTSNPNTFDYSRFIAGQNEGHVTYVVTSQEEDNINKYNKEIAFILFDKNKFQKIAEVEGFIIYKFFKS